MPDWDQLYTDRSVEDSHAAEVLLNNKYLLPEKADALDYACGLGGNSVLLAQQGFEVIALDRSSVAIDKINNYAKSARLSVSAEARDLELDPPDYSQRFDMIVVSYFLHRQTLPKLYDYLKKDGLLFYQTFSGRQFNQQGPANPDFRLQRNELLSVFANMELLYYREDPEISAGEGALPGQVQFVAKK